MRGTGSALDVSVQTTPTYLEVAGVWVIRLENDGRVQEYRCATERQAKQLAQVLAGQPLSEFAAPTYAT